MRDIFFRGKRLDNGEWVEGNLFIPDKVTRTDVPTEILIGTNIVRISYEVDPSTVGQCTGLTDKNGKKIFEGDVVQDVRIYLVHLQYAKEGRETQEQADKYKNYGKIGVVQYNADGGVGSCGCCYTEFVGAGFLAHHVDLTQCIVLGNIHDNSELLEGGEDIATEEERI